MNITRTSLNRTPAAIKKPIFDKPETTTITRTFDVPVTNSEHLGSIPSDRYEHAFSSWGNSTWGSSHYHSSTGHGGVGIYRDVPQYNSNGSPRMRTVTETLTEDSYDPKVRSMIFSGLGAVAGVAGVALASHLQAGAILEPLAMGISATVGAASGFALGYQTAKGDTVKEVWENHAIQHPRMDGYTETVTADTYTEETNCRYEKNDQGQNEHVCDTETKVRGYWHRYEEDISWRTVGNYDRPALKHTNLIGPILGGTMTVAGAGAIGVGVRALLGL